jgi:hypothetical protein
MDGGVIELEEEEEEGRGREDGRSLLSIYRRHGRFQGQRLEESRRRKEIHPGLGTTTT